MCIFCKIIKGEIPCAKVYEDEDTIAFLDIAPVNKGHVLVLPKQHYETIVDCPEEIMKKVISSVKKVSESVKKISDGLCIMVNNFSASGQEVPHIHFHIIPRMNNDGLKHWPQGKYDEDMEEYRKKIEDNI